MPLFKVWSGDRSIKKCVMADSLEKFVTEAKRKLAISGETNCAVVLMKDGTEIDEDDILLGFVGEVFLLLCNGEQWKPEVSLQTVELSTMRHGETLKDIFPMEDLTPAGSQDLLTSPGTSVPVTSITSPGTSSTYSSASDTEDSVSLTDSNDDITRKLKTTPLPSYGPLVLRHLNEKKPELVWSRLIRETASHYYGLYPGIGESAHYRVIGQMLVAAYPCISQEGNHPWSLFIRNLSQKVRHIRHSIKAKSQELPKHQGPKPKRVFRVVSPEPMLAVAVDGEEGKTHMEELKAEWEKLPKNRSESHIKMLLKFTRPAREDLLRKNPDGQLKFIIDEFPCLSEGRYLLYDMSLLIGADKMGRLGRNIEQLCIAVEDVAESKFEGPFRYIDMLEAIEEATKIVKGKGKTKNIVQIKEDVPDSDVDKYLTTRPMDAPHIAIFKSSGACSGIFIIGGGITINANTTDCRLAVELLLACYYVFDLDYPRMFAMVLGILQSFVMNDPYRLETSKNYKFFIKKLRKSFDAASKSETAYKTYQ